MTTKRSYISIKCNLHCGSSQKSRSHNVPRKKGRIIASPSKFIYEQSRRLYEENKGQKTAIQYDDIQRINHLREMTKQKGLYSKTLLIKMPRERIQGCNQISMAVRYEKQILCHFRTSRCRYLPRNYHSDQQNYEYKHCLHMDYIPGLTLAQQLGLKSSSISLKSKLTILSHLSYAIRMYRRISNHPFGPNSGKHHRIAQFIHQDHRFRIGLSSSYLSQIFA